MRIAFAGTPAFAATALGAILDGGFDVCVVLSQPDRPAGRGQRVQASAVKRLALERGIEVLTPARLRSADADPQLARDLQRLHGAAPDLLVVAAYGLLLPEAVLRLPRGWPMADGADITAINIHASLLPRWRGAAPVVRAIEAGDRHTGISIMEMEKGLDTGPILLMESIEIAEHIHAGALTEQLAQLGGVLIVRALHELAQGCLQRRAQPQEGVLYARKVEKSEAWLDWRAPAQQLADRIRAFDPFPGACGRIAGVDVKFWEAQALPAPGRAIAPGTVFAVGAQGIEVVCGLGHLSIKQLQRAGGRRLPVQEFLAGTPIRVGDCWAPPAADGH